MVLTRATDLLYKISFLWTNCGHERVVPWPVCRQPRGFSVPVVATVVGCARSFEAELLESVWSLQKRKSDFKPTSSLKVTFS